MTKAIIKKQTNSKGVTFALVSEGDVFFVYKLCSNYASHVRGGIARTWRAVSKNRKDSSQAGLRMTRDEAEAIFKKRVA